MALLKNSYLDLADIAKRENPNGAEIDVIEMLNALNPVMEDAYVQECNQGTTHLHSVRTGLPSVAWGRLYKGIPQSKGAYAQVTDTTGFVEGLSTVDERVLKLAKNPAALRLQEAYGFLEAIAQEMQSKFFYGSTDSDPDQIKGLADRFGQLTGAKNSTQIVDAGGTGNDNTSIWLVGWGPKQCSLLYPRGTQAGIEREDKGSQKVYDADNAEYWAMQEKFTQHCGVAVADWRYVVRIANIDVSEMEAGNVDLYKFLRKAYYKMHNRRIPMGRISMYANKDVLESLDALATNAGAGDNFTRLKTTEVEGREVKHYREFPIREVDATILLNTEGQVT